MNLLAILVVTVLTSGGPHNAKPIRIRNGVIHVVRNGAVIASAKSGKLKVHLKPGLYRVSGSSPDILQGRTCQVRSVRLRRGHTTRVNLYCSIK